MFPTLRSLSRMPAAGLPGAALCMTLLAAAPAFSADADAGNSTATPAAAPPAGSPATGDTAPFDVPAEIPPPGQIPSGDIPPFDPNFDATLPTIPESVPAAATGPDYKAPAVDAYVDLSFTDSDASNFTFRNSTGGYRFLVGFLLEKPLFGKLRVAPEVGYLRMGRAHDETTTVTPNVPIPQYDNIRTDLRELDMSTLQFDLRGGYTLFGPVEVYARAGVHFYHLAHKSQTVLSYTPIPPNTTARDTDYQQTVSSTDVGSDLFGAVGIACSVGQVPSLFVEYGRYSLGGTSVNVVAFGALLNF